MVVPDVAKMLTKAGEVRMAEASFFLESTFTDQSNPKRQTADPLWGSPKLDLLQQQAQSALG